jgi:triosephosphate isomerase
MRKPFICGNWKMHLLPDEAAAFARQLVERVGSVSDVDVAVAPTFVALAAVKAAIAGSRIQLFAQNCHWEPQGAFTGEVSAVMLKAIGCHGVIVGHSERRQYFGETDQAVNKRARAAINAGLRTIICVGETLAEREAGLTLSVVGRQVRAALEGIPGAQIAALVLAYEPVWAIGTGKVATAAQAEEVHEAIRGWVAELAGADVAGKVVVQYGGSVKPSSAAELLREKDVDGALVGGASLKVEDFSLIIQAAAQTL